MPRAENLIRYYKECVFEDSSDAIIACTDSPNSYVKIDGDELSTRDPIDFSELEKTKISQFIKETFKRIPSPSFWYGFPILFIERGQKKSIKPIFYFQINYNEEKIPGIINKIHPKINNSAFNDLGIENEEIKGFVEEIELYQEKEELDFQFLIEKMKEVFPDFNYQKSQNNGVFFKGVIFSSEQSRYTQGLDFELNKLLTKDLTFSKSCLGYYINPDEKKKKREISNSISRLLEVYELNDIQKKALKQSFEDPITVITGPPGTGKSQVVASLILNSILSNQRVLFASKNHKAIKVVEEKFNNLIGQPFLIRLGKQDNEGNNLRKNLISYLNWLLHSNISDEIEDKIEACENQLEKTTRERNSIKEKIEKYRLIRNNTISYFRKNHEKYEYDNNYRTLINKIKTSEQLRRKNLINKKIRDVALYLKNMNGAHKISTFESLLESDDQLNQEIKKLSEIYLKLWFEAFPKKLNADQKKYLDSYIDVLESLMIDNLSKKQIHNLIEKRNDLQNKVTEFLHSWCVTNLSIRGEIPLIEGFFDLLIIDEASQCDIASVIPMLFRSKRVVVLGDPFQLTHIASIDKKRSLELLHNYELEEFYNYKTRSFFDISQTLVNESSTIFLNEHFRSHSDIISFSKNYQKWYNGKLLISTDYRRLNPQPSIDGHSLEWIDVKGLIKQVNSKGAYINEEVDCVVDKAVEILNNSDFDGEIGIISPFRLQTNKIREKLHYKLSDRNRNRVLVETTHKFQGDEKDIIIFSPVISENIPKRAIYHLQTDYLLNVAITRARAKLIIVGNKKACINCKVQHYKDFAEYVDGVLSGEIQNIEQKSESIYEEILYKAMKDAGIEPIPQYTIGQYRLDFAIIENDLKIDIEVDGKQYHTDWSGDRLKADIVRNQRLQNLGWKVLRFWSYEIRDNIEYCIERIKETVEV